MRTWFVLSILIVSIAIGTLGATGQDAKQLAAKGHEVFVEVLGGDQAKYAEAVKYMEQSRQLDPANTNNLYNLARAYFYDALTTNNSDSATKAEQTLAKLIELKPTDTRALAFHGSILTSISGGKDIPKFMQGASEMKAAIEKDPQNINNRIVLPFTARNFPPQALAAMGNYDALKDLEFVRDAFNGQTFYYAPHADVVMKALVGEAYKARGDAAKAKANFEAALAVPKPAKAGERAGRDVLDNVIRARMNGGDKPIGNGVFSGCHSCHLNAPDKILR
jgi:tetratricopeptide (TPR) repeat protein